jgi:hypothetical protein
VPFTTNPCGDESDGDCTFLREANG